MLIAFQGKSAYAKGPQYYVRHSSSVLLITTNEKGNSN